MRFLIDKPHLRFRLWQMTSADPRTGAPLPHTLPLSLLPLARDWRLPPGVRPGRTLWHRRLAGAITGQKPVPQVLPEGTQSPVRGLFSGRRRGFTLIELLTVIAIVSLLIAILLPTLSAARRQGRRLDCQNNLRQIAMAWHSYLDANGESFLQGVNVDLNFGGRQGKGAAEFGADAGSPVSKLLNSQLGMPEVIREGAEVFACPADEGSRTIRPTHFEFYGTSYATNFLLIGQNQFWYPPFDPCAELYAEINRRLPRLKRGRISGEARLLLVGDFGWRITWNRWETDPKRKTEWHDVPNSHNLAFMDGHVSFVRIRKGLHVTPDYTIIPFETLLKMAEQCQEEAP